MRDLRILYFEDDELLRETLTEHLVKVGARVQATSKEAGLQAFNADAYDVVLCDLIEPMEGLGVLVHVRGKASDIPFIMCAVTGTVDLAVESMQLGASDFLLHPLDGHKLEKAIRACLERRAAQVELAQRQASLSVIMENVPDVIYSLDPEGHFLSVSPAAENMLGYTPLELQDRLVFDFIHPDDRQQVIQGFRRAMQEGDQSVRTVEFRMSTKTGEVCHCEVNRRLIFDKGKVIRQDGIVRDVTARKQLESKLIERTQTLRKVNNKLRSKARELESKTYSLANSNVQLLTIQEELELKNQELANLLDELRRERNFVSAILDTAAALVVVLDTEGRIIRFNRACEETTGYTLAEVEGRHFWEIFVIPSQLVAVRGVFDSLRAGDFPNQYENYWLSKKGDHRLIAWTNTAMLTDDGVVEYVIGTGIDITERKETEEKLRLYKQIFMNSNDPINILDAHGFFVEQNPAHRRLNGYSDGEIVGQTPALITDTDTFQRIVNSLRDTGVFRGEVITRSKTGQRFHVELSAFTMYDDNGEVANRVGFARDITERKRAEEKIAHRLRYEEGLAACSRALLEGREDEEALQTAIGHLLEAAEVGRVYIFENFEDDADGLCLRITHEVCAKGVTPQIDNPFLQHAPYGQGFQRWQDILSKGQPLQDNIENLPETERAVLEAQDIKSILVLPIQVGGAWFGFIGFDDVERKREWGEEDVRLLQTAAEMVGGYIEHRQAEDALKQSEERFRSVAQSAHDAIISADHNGIIIAWNQGAHTIFGYEESEIIGKSLNVIVPQRYRKAHEAGLKRVTEEGTTQLIGRVVQFEGLRKDGTEFPMELSLAVWRVADDTYYSGIIRDITERKEAEELIQRAMDELADANRHLRETQGQLVQSEKMASLGMLVAGIAHEINTPIGAVHSMHDTLKRATHKLRENLHALYPDEMQTNPKLSRPLEIIENANRVIDSGSQRVTDIVRRLRSFARLDEAELKKVDIHEGLEDTLTLIHHEIKHNITVVRDFAKLPPIACFPGRLNQVFLNLLINAKQAIKGEGEIHIKTFAKEGKVYVQVTDSGVGIPAEQVKKIFDPGYTTKGVGVGTGLGLSIVYQIIEEHHGEIDVKSEVNKGTTFSISLPMNLDEVISV